MRKVKRKKQKLPHSLASTHLINNMCTIAVSIISQFMKEDFEIIVKRPGNFTHETLRKRYINRGKYMTMIGGKAMTRLQKA